MYLVTIRNNSVPKEEIVNIEMKTQLTPDPVVMASVTSQRASAHKPKKFPCKFRLLIPYISTGHTVQILLGCLYTFFRF